MDNSWKNSERQKRIVEGWPKFRKLLFWLLGFSVLLLAWNVFGFFFRNREIEGIISSVGQILLVSGMIFNGAAIRAKENERRNNIISFIFLVPASVCIGLSFWLNLS